MHLDKSVYKGAFDVGSADDGLISRRPDQDSLEMNFGIDVEMPDLFDVDFVFWGHFELMRSKLDHCEAVLRLCRERSSFSLTHDFKIWKLLQQGRRFYLLEKAIL